MEKLERYLQFMREAERLKNVLRSARTSTGRHESTAEHTWRLALLALVLADEKPELDLPRVLAMCLVHDLGEAYEGDIPAVAQCDPASKAAAELAAMERLTPLLPAEAAARIRTYEVAVVLYDTEHRNAHHLCHLVGFHDDHADRKSVV